jgi:AcrR family transcriptional regulator
MASRREWLETGRSVVERDGAQALTIERLCAELGVTKGSFYHHFKGIPGFKKALLTHLEDEHTGRFIADAEIAGASARGRLQRLLDLVLDDKNDSDGLETALRSWALQDPEVRAFQQHVDGTRIGYLRGLWRDLGAPQAETEPMARLLYLVLIGAQQIIPPVPATELRQIYELVLRLAPHDPREQQKDTP